MSNKLSFVAAFAMIFLLSACKKSEGLKPDLSVSDTKVSLAGSSTANKVITIAGVANSSGLVDGAGSTAKFNAPAGIQLLNDG